MVTLLLDEFHEIFPHLDEVRFVQIEHVPGIIPGEVDGFATFVRNSVHVIMLYCIFAGGVAKSV